MAVQVIKQETLQLQVLPGNIFTEVGKRLIDAPQIIQGGDGQPFQIYRDGAADITDRSPIRALIVW